MTRKEKELMIGDWLQHASGKYFQITRLDMWGDGSVHFACGHPHLWEYNNKFSPIPLTAEILQRNGFENDFYHDESVADYHFVRLEGYSYREEFSLVQWCNGELNVVNDLIGEVKIHCENVHELQHALRLCNIEKEIEL